MLALNFSILNVSVCLNVVELLPLESNKPIDLAGECIFHYSSLGTRYVIVGKVVVRVCLIELVWLLFTWLFTGQIELYTHLPVMKQLVEQLQQWEFRVCGVFLVDSQFMVESFKVTVSQCLPLIYLIFLF